MVKNILLHKEEAEVGGGCYGTAITEWHMSQHIGMKPGTRNLEPGRAGKRLATPKDAKERKEVVRQLDTLRVFVSLCLCVFVSLW